MGIGADRFARQSNEQFYVVAQHQVKKRGATGAGGVDGKTASQTFQSVKVAEIDLAIGRPNTARIQNNEVEGTARAVHDNQLIFNNITMTSP
jgi:hypothetical protein